MADKVFLGFLAVAFITVVCGDWCYDFSGDHEKTVYCAYGCCGDNDDRCCNNVGYIGDGGTGYVVAIVGIVIGSLALVAIIVSIAVCCCCCRRKQAIQGHVVATVVTTSSAGAPPYSVTTQMAYPQTGYPTGIPEPYAGPYPARPPAGDQQRAQQVAQPPPYSDVQSK